MEPWSLVAGLATGFGAFVVVMTQRRTNPENAPRHPARRKILDVIRGRPGARIFDIHQSLGINRGTTKYHLIVLKRVGAVRVQPGRTGPRYFPADMREPLPDHIALLLRGRMLEIAKMIRERPGSIQRDVIEALGLSRKVFREHVELLGRKDLVREVREHPYRRYYPTPNLDEALAAMGRDKGARGP